jgi:hypothetical protein
MMHKKICLTSNRSVGCTFVDWSIHFLSGQTKFYQAEDDRWLDLTTNPLGKENAHNHLKNHPKGYDSTLQVFEKFNKQSTGIFSVYPGSLTVKHAYKKLNLEFDQEKINEANDYSHQDFAKIFDLCHEYNTKIIYIHSDSEIDLYHLETRHTTTEFFSKPGVGPVADVADEFEGLFFDNAIEGFKESTHIWDVKERKALNFNIPNFKSTYPTYPTIELEHFWVDSRTVWTLGEETMRKILDYVELKLDNDRLTAWLPIYNKWQTIQFKHLNFCYVFPHIIESIINNWYYELDNLSLIQEIAIQSYLIRKHNLNLKTWQLSKFPSNTKDLHALLEPNIHQF